MANENLKVEILGDILSAIERHQHARREVFEALVAAVSFQLAATDPAYRSILAAKLQDDVPEMLKTANRVADDAARRVSEQRRGE